MTRIALSLAIAVSMASLLGACQRTEPTAAVDADPQSAEPITPTEEAAAALAASADNDDVGGSFAEGISADAITAAAQDAPAYGAADGPDLDALKAAVDRVQQSNERMRQIEASKPRGSAGAPAPSAPSAPASPQGLPPVQFRLTGDSIVPRTPALANDVMRGMQRVFAAQTGCTAITGIDTRAVSAQGPFDKNAQGRLVSGTIVERWDVTGCGKTAAYHLVMRVRPDSTVDYVIQRA